MKKSGKQNIVSAMCRQAGYAVCAAVTIMLVNMFIVLFSIKESATKTSQTGIRMEVENTPERLTTQFSLTPVAFVFFAGFVAVWLAVYYFAFCEKKQSAAATSKNGSSDSADSADILNDLKV